MTSVTLSVDRLVVEIATAAGPVRPVDDVSLEVAPGQVHGVVGESGCGKSTLLRSILGLLPPTAHVAGGSVTIAEPGAQPRPLRRGSDVSMVFQDPSMALNPVIPIGRQLRDGAARHLGLGRKDAIARSIDLLRRVGVPDAEQRMRSYPHQLSGGLRQRVMIAVALSSAPKVLLCDEPTTALDVTVQDQVLGLLDDIRRTDGLGIVFVSHDLAVVASMCSTVSVMYAGRVVEQGPTDQVFSDPRHAYTRGLLASVPDVFRVTAPSPGIPGAPPDLAALPQGCAFAPRCGSATDVCASTRPELVSFAPRRAHACTLQQLEVAG